MPTCVALQCTPDLPCVQHHTTHEFKAKLQLWLVKFAFDFRMFSIQLQLCLVMLEIVFVAVKLRKHKLAALKYLQ